MQQRLRGAGCHLKVHNRSRFSASGVTGFSPLLPVVLVLTHRAIAFPSSAVTSRHCHAGQSHGQKSGSCSLLIVQINSCTWENSWSCLTRSCRLLPRGAVKQRVTQTDPAALLCARDTQLNLDRTHRLKHLKLSETKSLSHLDNLSWNQLLSDSPCPKGTFHSKLPLSNTKVASACRQLLIQTAAQGQGKSPPNTRSKPRAGRKSSQRKVLPKMCLTHLTTTAPARVNTKPPREQHPWKWEGFMQRKPRPSGQGQWNKCTPLVLRPV